MVNRKQHGFTIVELLIIIVVIAILAALVLMAFNNLTKRAHETGLKSDLSQAAKQLQLDKTSNGTYPATIAAANNGNGLKSSPGTAYEYTVDNGVNPPSFCLSAVNGAYAFRITQSGPAVEGVCAGHTGPASEGGSPSTYAVGDTGPAGGKVFYDKGSVSSGWRYLEAASSDLSRARWGCKYWTLSGADGTAIGTGKQNTIDIINGCPDAGTAAKVADAYTQGGYDDWFLPSKDELNHLYQQRVVIGGFQTFNYWSSTEYSDANSWQAYFPSGEAWDLPKDYDHYVRPVRSF